MIEVWPSELPRPERESWQLAPQDARRKARSEAGPPRYRRRFSSAAQVVALTIRLDRNQRAIFDRFFHDVCAEGARLFRMPDPTTEGWPLLTDDGRPILTDGGEPILLGGQWICAWGDDMPTETVFAAVRFRKSFTVVIMP